MSKTSSSGSGSIIAIIIVYNNKYMYKLVSLKYKLDFKSTYRLGLRLKYFKLRARHIVMFEITLMQ